MQIITTIVLVVRLVLNKSNYKLRLLFMYAKRNLMQWGTIVTQLWLFARRIIVAVSLDDLKNVKELVHCDASSTGNINRDWINKA